MKTLTFHSKIIYWLVLISLLNIGANTPIPATLQTDAIVFAVIGDYGTAGQAEADVARLVKSWNPNFIVTVGDNNYPDGASYSIDKNIGQYYHDYIFRYTGKYGGGSDTRKFFPAMGNHDWHEGSPNAHVNYFDLPGNERYYDFAYGSVHFFILDSISYEPDGNTAASAQGKWLQKALASSVSPYNIVVTHYSPYSSGQHGSVGFMQWPFKEWGADVVLAGHDHLYERLLVNGFPYFVNGAGGGENLYNFRSAILPESQARYNQNYGAMRVEASSAYMKFQFYSRDNILIDEYVLGSTIPTVSAISSSNTKLSNASNLDFNVIFSEPVTGVDASDFVLTTNGINGAFISNISGTDSNYVVSVNTGTGDGTLRFDLINDSSIASKLGIKLDGGIFSSEIYTLDKTAPIVTSITRVGASPTNAANVDFAVTFSEPVSGVDILDFSLSSQTGVSGAAIINLNGSGASYLTSISSGNGDDVLRLDMINNNSIMDAAGNLPGGNFTTGESYATDKTAPNIISILRTNPNPSSAAVVDFSVTFSEPVSGVDAADFILSANNISGAYIASINGSGNAYTVSANTGSGSGDLRLDSVNDLSIVDAAGNTTASTFSGETYTIDKTAPIALSILRMSAERINAGSVDFNMIFSEPVIGVDALDFVLTANGINGAYVSGVNGSNANYVISVNSGAGDGTLHLDLIDDDSIKNMAGSPLGTAGIGNGNFISTETYTIDKTPPVVISIARANPNPSTENSVNFTVNFSEPVSGVDNSDFILNATGVSGASISNASGANSSYVVSVTTGINNGTLRLDLVDNNSITDSTGNMIGGININDGSFTTGEIYEISKPVTTPADFPAPITIAPMHNALLNTSTPKLSWIKVEGAQSYEIFIAQDSGFAQTIQTQIVRDISYTNQQLNDGIYYWRVRAYTASGQPGKFSITETFTTDTTPPAVPNLLSPLDGARLSARFKFAWTNYGAARYQIEVDNNADFSSPEWSSWRRDANYQISSMRKGTYYWHVRAKDMADNWSAWSTVFKLIVP